MPITQLSLQCALSVTLQKVLAGFVPVKAGPNKLEPGLGGIDLTVYTQAYQGELTGTTTIDLRSFTNLAGEAVVLSKALALVVTCSGGSVVMTPGASNGLTGWFFPAAGITLADGDSIVFLRDPTQTPVTVDATHRTITFTVTGTPTVDVAIIGG